MLTVGSLFSGIGGFDLGFERAGMRTVWFAEQDQFCRRVLAERWPGVPCFPDVRSLVADTKGQRWGGRFVPREDVVDNGPESAHGATGDREGDGLPVSVPYVDVLCGGFPCQDISLAGRGAGIGGSRSGLWGEFARLVGELRPRYVVVENVPAITSRGLDVVLADLAACGFDAEWDHLPASAFGAPHRRDRFWLVGYPNIQGPQGHGRHDERPDERFAGPAGAGTGEADEGRSLDDTVRGRHGGEEGQVRPGRDGSVDTGWWEFESDVRGVPDGLPEGLDGGLDASHANSAVASQGDGPEGLLRELWERVAAGAPSHRRGSDEQLARELADALSQLPHEVALGPREGTLATTRSYVFGLRSALSTLGAVSNPSEPLAPAWLALSAEDQAWVGLAVVGGGWSAEWPGVGRVAHGVPDRVDRLRALGNSLVPQIAEWIGYRIVSWENER